MDIEGIRRHCLQFPHTTENVQWGATLCFKVDNKLFVVAALEPGPVRLSFKCSPENFLELCERPGIRPAPYMARAQWVSLEQLNTLPDFELRDLITEAYRLIFEHLPKRRQAELQARPAKAASARRPAAAKSKKPATKSTKRKAAAKRTSSKAKSVGSTKRKRGSVGGTERARSGRRA